MTATPCAGCPAAAIGLPCRAITGRAARLCELLVAEPTRYGPVIVDLAEMDVRLRAGGPPPVPAVPSPCCRAPSPDEKTVARRLARALSCPHATPVSACSQWCGLGGGRRMVKLAVACVACPETADAATE